MIYMEQIDHHPQCPAVKYNAGKLTTRTGARLRLSRLVSALVDINFSFTKGAGGYSLSPSLQYTAITDYMESPVTSLISEFCYVYEPHGSVPLSAHLEQLRRGIAGCFERREASPVDQFLDFYPGGYWQVSDKAQASPKQFFLSTY